MLPGLSRPKLARRPAEQNTADKQDEETISTFAVTRR